MSARAASLGRFTVKHFLRQHWQKLPLFLPAAVPRARDLLSPDQLVEFASDERCRSRLVARRGNTWQVRHGPFDPAALRRLPRSGWALLVQDLNLVSQAAHDLMMEFSFIPYARMDDLMASLAPPGGGVGPHFDSYDVFLVQGAGARRWEVSSGGDLSVYEDLPLRILRNFNPGQSFDCHPGDMLYLPPGVAHNGVALETCITYSVGFRSPSFQELVSGFLAHLDDHQRLRGLYADPDLEAQDSPARIPDAMAKAVQAHISALDLSGANVRRYLGCFLTDPQPHVVFQPPLRPVSRVRFTDAAQRRGVVLVLATRMLWSARDIFINGDHVSPAPDARPALRKLADNRRWAPDATLPASALDLAYQWYRAGYLLPADRISSVRSMP